MLKRLGSVVAVIGLAVTLRGEEPPKEAKPGAEHARLKSLAGTWEMEGKFTMMPGTEGTKAKGTVENRMLGGRYLQSIASMDAGGHHMEMLSTCGYNLYLKKYFYIFFIHETGGFVVTEGTMDAEGKVLTLEGGEELPDGQEMKVKVVFRFLGEDTHSMEWWFPGEGGKMFMAGEYTYTRKK